MSTRCTATLLSLALAACGGATPAVEPSRGGESVTIDDPAAWLAGLEARLRSATSVDVRTSISSEGPYPSALEGTVALEGERAEWALEGTFGGRPVALSLHADGARETGGTASAPVDVAQRPELRDAIATGLVRMGLLHNCAQLAGGEPPDVRASSTSGWVVLTGVSAGAAEAVDGARAIPIRASIEVGGSPMGEATLWIDAATRLPVRREQRVAFPQGEMRVVERYLSFEVR